MVYTLLSVEVERFRLALEVLNVIEKYGRHVTPGSHFAGSGSKNEPQPSIWPGKMKFLPHVYYFVRDRKPVQLTLPAFPCKSVGLTYCLMSQYASNYDFFS